MDINQKAKTALLVTLICSWSYALFLSQRQAEVCERKSGSDANQCSIEWQLATTTAMGVAQTILGIFFPSDSATGKKEEVDPFSKKPTELD